MKIERMHKGDWGKTLAYFDVRTSDGFIIKGFKLVNGVNGMFVGKPQQKDKEGEYRDTTWIPEDSVREELLQMALDTYNEGESVQQNKEPEEFSDDEIPF